jgi:RHS repeat-associated protein
MSTFPISLIRYPVSLSSPVSATNFCYASDFGFGVQVGKSLPAGSYGVWQFDYAINPTTGAAPNFVLLKWRLTWTNAPSVLMEFWISSTNTWINVTNQFPNLNPVTGWPFVNQVLVAEICRKIALGAGLTYLLQNVPTTYGVTETVYLNGVLQATNTSATTFDVRMLAVVNSNVQNPIQQTWKFGTNFNIQGQFAALPRTGSAFSPFPSTNFASWQPTVGSQISTSLKVCLAVGTTGPTVYTPAAQNVPVTAIDSQGIVSGTFSLPWNGLNSNTSKPSVGYYIAGVTGTTTTGDITNNVNWPGLSAMQCIRCLLDGLNGSSSTNFLTAMITNPFGMDMGVGLSYSSANRNDPAASFGYGWKSIHNVTVSIDASGNLLYQDESGNLLRWNFNSGPGTYTPFTNENYVLATRNIATQRYILTFKDSTQRVFYDMSFATVAWRGRLAQTIDRNGNTLTYSYDSLGHLTQVVDSTGSRTLFYNYGSRTDGQPESIRANNNVSGHQTQFAYYLGTDPSPNRLKSITDPAGDTTTFTYDPATQALESVIDATGKTARLFFYNSIGQLSQEFSYYDPATGAYETVTSYVYGVDVLANLRTNATSIIVQDTSGTPTRVSVMYQDANGNVVQTKELVNDAGVVNTTVMQYSDTVSNNPYLVTQVTNPNGTTKFTYNINGNLATTTDNQLNLTSYQYAEDTGDTNVKHRNLLVKLTRPVLASNGGSSYTPEMWAYDTNGNLLTYTDATGHTIGYTPNSDGTINHITDQNNNVTSFQYISGTKNLLSITTPKYSTDPVGPSQRITTFTYADGYDNVTKVTDALGNHSDFVFDADRRVTQITDPLSNVSTMTYIQGLLTESLSPPNQASGTQSRKTYFGYDQANRVNLIRRDVAVATPRARVSFTRNGFGDVVQQVRQQLTNGPTNITTSSYDALGRMIASIDPLGRLTSVNYAPFCTRQTVNSARGVQLEKTFDSLCRLTRLATQNEIRAFSYDELSRMVSDMNGSRYGWNIDPVTVVGGRYGTGVYANGRTTQYNSLDQVVLVTFSDGKTMSYDWDPAGNLKQVVDIFGQATNYQYFPDNRLMKVSFTYSGTTYSFDYTYDLAGRPLTISFPTGTNIVLSFTTDTGATGWDAAGRLVYMRYLKSGVNLVSFNYGYDPSGNRVSLIERAGTTVVNTWAYTYDWLDRLKTVTLNGVLKSTYDYDNSDNRISLTQGANAFTYQLDSGDQLLSRKLGAAVQESYVNDQDGNMVSRTAGASTTSFVWSDFNNLVGFALNGVTQETDAYESDGVRRTRSDGSRYTSSAGMSLADQRPTVGPVSYIQGHQLMGLQEGGAVYFFLTDGLGSVRQVVNNVGTPVATNLTDEYGAVPTSTGSTELLAHTYVGGLGVRNEMASRGLYYMRQRWMDPVNGRFLSADPIGFQSGQLNKFGYTTGNPINAVDPSGLAFVDFAKGFGKTVATGLAAAAVIAGLEVEIPAAIAWGIGSLALGYGTTTLATGRDPISGRALSAEEWDETAGGLVGIPFATPGGYRGPASMGGIDPFRRLMIRGLPRFYGGRMRFSVHAGANGFETQAKIKISSECVANRIVTTPGYKQGMPVELITCDGGLYAQELANLLGAEVIATDLGAGGIFPYPFPLSESGVWSSFFPR